MAADSHTTTHAEGPSMDLFAQAAIGFGILIGGIFTGWQSWHARREARSAAGEARTAAGQAAKAAEATAPVGNGFAGDVLDRLSRIESTGQVTKALAETTHQLMVGHLEAHADSDLRK